MTEPLKTDYGFLASLFAFLFFVFMLIGQGSVQSSDGINLLNVTKNIVEHQTFAIESGVTQWDSFTVGSDGMKYSKYAPAVSVLLAPIFFVAKIFEVLLNVDPSVSANFAGSIFNSVICSLIGAVLFLWCRKVGYSYRVSLVTVLAYSFLTMNMVYSKELYSHPLATLCLLLSCYFIYPVKDINNKRAVAAGLFMGLTILSRYEFVVMAPILAFFILVHAKSGFSQRIKIVYLFSLFVFISIGLILFYNYYRYGGIFSTGGYSAHERISLSNFFEGLFITIFSTGHGLLIFNPILLVSIFGFKKLYEQNREFFFLALTVIIPLIIFYSIVGSVVGGAFCWGPRHLICVLPFLVIPLGIIKCREIKVLMKATILLVALLSFSIQLSSILVNPSRYYHELGLKYDGEIFYSANYNPKESIIIKQWEYIIEIAHNSRNAQFIEKMKNSLTNPNKEKNPGIEYILKNNISLNVYNFWWVYMYFAGFSVYLIGGAVLGLVCMIFLLGYNIYRSIRNLEKIKSTKSRADLGKIW